MKIKNSKAVAFFCVIFFTVFTNVFAQNTKVATISKDSLPQVIKDAFKKKYASYKITMVNKIRNIEMNDLTYEVEAETSKKSLQLVYNDKGQLLKKSSSKILWYDGTEKVTPKSTPSKANDGHNHSH